MERGKILALRADDCRRLGLAARSVGISLGPGLVDFVDGPSLSAEPPDLAAKQLMIDLLEKQ